LGVLASTWDIYRTLLQLICSTVGSGAIYVAHEAKLYRLSPWESTSRETGSGERLHRRFYGFSLWL